jgi:putative hydrolase
MRAAMANPQINTLNHIYRIVFPVNIEKVAQTACDQGKLLEISIAVFSKKKIPDEVVERISRMIKVVKQNKQKILLGSDAHIATEIGEDKGFNKYKKKLGLTAKDIANNDIKYLRKFVKNI